MPEGSEYEDVSSLEDGGLYSADDLMSLYSPQFYQVTLSLTSVLSGNPFPHPSAIR